VPKLPNSDFKEFLPAKLIYPKKGYLIEKNLTKNLTIFRLKYQFLQNIQYNKAYN